VIAAVSKKVRCAIYTRVSTEAGLDQDFNSLDAQYDAAQAYIRSQAHAGWTLVTTVAFRADQPIGPPYSIFSPTLKRGRSMSLSSTKLTA